jgi:hypothetical protein
MKFNLHILGLLFIGATLLMPQLASATPCTTAPLKYRYALLGNPVSYPEWTEQNLRALKDAGFNGIQLNIAWLRRPNDEALNLNDVVTLPGDEEASRTRERREELQRRQALAKKVGLRTMFHFGSPFMWRDPATGQFYRQSPAAFHGNWYEVQDPRVVEYETSLLKEFRKAFPEVDDILIYTYDQDAWQVSEFTSSTLSRGIPLHERLPAYLQKLHAVWTDGRSSGDNTVWWEPWELSAGQVYHCLPHLPRTGFGLMLHNNIAEVQVSMPVDVWFRNTARMAADLGIPVVGEGFFGSATEEIEPLSFPFPRLTDEQFLAMGRIPGVVGVKEYFGVIPSIGDLNLEMFSARVAAPDACTDDLLTSITSRFGIHQPRVLHWLEELSRAMQTYPWDVSWYSRLIGTANPDHGWDAAFVRGQQVDTPSWESTRRAHFMMTEDRQPHPFFLEDIHLRIEICVQHLDAALSAGKILAAEIETEPYRTMIQKANADVAKFRQVALSYALHMRETNVARLLREDAEAGRPLPEHLVAEMRELLQADANNQGESGRAKDKLKEFNADPKAFVLKHLKPTEKNPREKGVFTLTTR